LKQESRIFSEKCIFFVNFKLADWLTSPILVE
jgi:hypothetical protein